MTLKPEKGYKGLEILEKALRNDKPVKIDIRELNWPKSGLLEVRNLSVRYREDLDFVLKNLSFVVPSGTKVGIVGRTGAGKTTLMSSIYRNFDEYEGEFFFKFFFLVDFSHISFKFYFKFLFLLSTGSSKLISNFTSYLSL